MADSLIIVGDVVGGQKIIAQIVNIEPVPDEQEITITKVANKDTKQVNVIVERTGGVIFGPGNVVTVGKRVVGGDLSITIE